MKVFFFIFFVFISYSAFADKALSDPTTNLITINAVNDDTSENLLLENSATSAIKFDRR